MIPNAPRLALAAGAIFSLAACERETIAVYTAPKDQPVAEQHFPGDGHDHGPEDNHASHAGSRPELPKFTWTLPAGWQEMPAGQMSAASFSIKADGNEAGVTVTPLPNLSGQEEMVVNMWRQQVGQEPLTAQQVKEVLSEVDVAGEKGQLFEIGGTRDGKPLKIVTAMLHGKGGASWFFKISGDSALVDAQRQAFLDFVKSVKFEESAAAPQTAAAPAATPTAPAAPAPSQFPTAAPTGEFKWTVPANWETVAPGQMQVAKFKVPEKDGATAEVAVSVFPSDTGGTLSNVNRWLGQLGKSPIQESELGSYVKPLEGGPEGAQLVTLSGDDTSMLSAIVPRDGRWWFYKMTGGAAAVNAARDEFVAFAKAQP